MPRNQGTSRKGKPKKNERAAGMGRSLMRAQPRRHTPKASTGGMAMREGVQSINVHAEEQRISVLEMNDLDDFLIQAEMANREFSTERESMVILDENTTTPSGMEDDMAPRAIQWSDQDSSRTPVVNDPFAFQELSVPRRPAWDETTTPAELDMREKESFLDWRRNIARKEEVIAKRSLGVTPFEKNIEIWRQLWRVMERCSVIVQIVDARNPLFYLSKDLKTYATKELGKKMILLINKSDYLSPVQRKAWHDYFNRPENAWEHVFFSAHEQQHILDQEFAAAQRSDDESTRDDVEQTDDNKASSDDAEHLTLEQLEKDVGVAKPLSRERLLDWLHLYATKHNAQKDKQHGRIPFGMVGFPNVGKSSVINVLMGNAKNAHGVVRVGVAAQPGKTKHFQTLLLPSRDDMLLCDCPGLVFPSFVNNTADLIAAGVFPIAQMRDPWPVIDLLCQRIPREVLNAQYGIQIPLPTPDAMLNYEPTRGELPPPTAEEFLSTYCVARGLLAASSGVPDYTRASRIVIKDYATGKLLYCHAPPDVPDMYAFQQETMKTALHNTKRLRDRLGKSEEPVDHPDNPAGDDHSEASSEDIGNDDMLLELMGDMSLAASSSQQLASKPAKKKKWGKKGRKHRNKDPYGCHSTPEDMLADEAGASVKAPNGVSVNAGKHGKKGYTRSTGYGGARSLH